MWNLISSKTLVDRWGQTKEDCASFARSSSGECQKATSIIITTITGKGTLQSTLVCRLRISMRINSVPLQRGLKNRIQCIVLEFMGNLQDPICQLHVYLVDSGHKGRAFSVPSQLEIGVVSLYEMSQWLLPLKAPQKTTTTIAQDEPVTQEWRNNIVATAPHQQEPNLGSLIHLGWYRIIISIPCRGCATCLQFPISCCC